MKPAVVIAVVLALAGPAAARLDPSAPGRFPVGVTTLDVVDATRNRTLVTEVWYPAASAARDARIRHGRFPLVLVAHGFRGFRTNYEYLTTWLAARGFVVAAPDLPGSTRDPCVGGATCTPDPVGDLRFLREAFHASSGAAAGFRRAIRGRRAAVVGHSLGTLAALRATIDDPDLAPAVVMAPLSAVTADDLARAAGHGVLVMASSADSTVALAGVVRLFGELPAPTAMVVVLGGSHSGFSDADASISAEALARQQAITRRYTTAFLLRYLVRDRRFTRFLSAKDAAAQGDDLTVTARLGARPKTSWVAERTECVAFDHARRSCRGWRSQHGSRARASGSAT